MSDDKEVVAALISLAGVIISVVIAYAASVIQTNTEKDSRQKKKSKARTGLITD